MDVTREVVESALHDQACVAEVNAAQAPNPNTNANARNKKSGPCQRSAGNMGGDQKYFATNVHVTRCRDGSQ